MTYPSRSSLREHAKARGRIDHRPPRAAPSGLWRQSGQAHPARRSRAGSALHALTTLIWRSEASARQKGDSMEKQARTVRLPGTSATRRCFLGDR